MPASSAVLTVTQLTSTIKELLEMGFPQLTVEGEISGLRSTNSKHLYFSLKDDRSVIKVVWFAWNAKGNPAEPQDGQRVRITGRLSVYEAQGVYQIVVSTLETVGLGELLARLERLKRSLETEGLFSADRKKPLPLFPEVVALVTSPTGAALQDMLRIFLQNEIGFVVRIFPVLVQGTEAAPQIASMLKYIARHHAADLIVVGRGGGSVEDLLAFSDEEVVRAVAASPIPVISAVGHEIDSPLSDFAADQKAPTPTAAAEILARPWSQLRPTVQFRKEDLADAISERVEGARRSLEDFQPDRLEESFRQVVQPAYQRLDDAKEKLLGALSTRLSDLGHRVALAKNSLEALNPLEVLRRGYAVVSDQRGKTLLNSSDSPPGTVVNIRYHKGRATATIEEIADEKL